MAIFFTIFGSFFILVGVLVFVLVTVVGGESMGIFFLVIFGCVGFVFTVFGINEMAKRRAIIKNGDRVWGVIVEYSDDTSTYINGIPALDIVVKCNYQGAERVCRLHTGQTSEERYPIGASIQLACYKNQVIYIPRTVGGYTGAAV